VSKLAHGGRMQYWRTPTNLHGFLDRTLAIRQRMVSLSRKGISRPLNANPRSDSL
jgi:hypothetical protein